jgi:hypothetical protein
MLKELELEQRSGTLYSQVDKSCSNYDMSPVAKISSNLSMALVDRLNMNPNRRRGPQESGEIVWDRTLGRACAPPPNPNDQAMSPTMEQSSFSKPET